MKAARRVAVTSPAASPGLMRPADASADAACMKLNATVVSQSAGLAAGINVLVRAIRARHGSAITASAVGLTAIIAAAFSGATFVSNQQSGASMAMALLTGVALLCYLANL